MHVSSEKVNIMDANHASFSRGFTLVEVLVTLVIVSVAVLSLGGFSLNIIGSGQVDRERLTAVHLAEQAIEYWQHDANDYAPKISSACVLSKGVAGTIFSANCTPTSGVSISYTINMDKLTATAPLPTKPNGNGTNKGLFAVRNMIGSAAAKPMIKAVMVTWSHKGKSRSVYLTSMATPR